MKLKESISQIGSDINAINKKVNNLSKVYIVKSDEQPQESSPDKLPLLWIDISENPNDSDSSVLTVRDLKGIADKLESIVG